MPTQDDFQFGLNGEAFVPESLPGQQLQLLLQENEPEISDPIHAARTAEMRQQAAQMRQQLEVAEDEFPDLLQSNTKNNNNGPLVGWSGQTLRNNGGRSRPTMEEAFPSLSSTTAPPQVSPALNFARQMARGRAQKQTASTTTKPKPYSLSSQRATAQLTPDQFPSLSSSNNNTYRAAQNYAKKIQTTTSKPLSYYRTPSLSTKPSSSNNNPRMNPPSASDFPSLGGTPNPYAKATAHAKLMKSKKKSPTMMTPAQYNNILLPTTNTPLSPQEQLMTLKSLLGQSNYKRLKTLTKNFANDILAHEQYVDQMASCFENGKKDSDFWTFVPMLIDSCPNDHSGKAMEYLATLRVAMDMEEGLNGMHPSSAIAAACPSMRIPSTTTTTTTTHARSMAASSKQNLAWSANGAAASLQQKQPSNGTSKKSKQKKKKNELKNLAFSKG